MSAVICYNLERGLGSRPVSAAAAGQITYDLVLNKILNQNLFFLSLVLDYISGMPAVWSVCFSA